MATESDQWGVWDVAGNTRTLVEPSQAWYDAREPEPAPVPDPVAALQAQVAELTAALEALVNP
jgi:hypothetical protein